MVHVLGHLPHHAHHHPETTNINGVLIGTEQIYNYVRESLLAIPPLLGFQRMIANLPGYVINDW